MLFTEKEIIHLKDCTLHSGGAQGSDLSWDEIGCLYGLKNIKHYSYQTKYHNSPNKLEISQSDYLDGVSMVKEANKILKRKNIEKYLHLLARNWAQIKYSDVTYAIGQIIQPGEKGSKGYINNANRPTVDGGTSYAVEFSILKGHKTYIFDQKQDTWFIWSQISKNFKTLKEVPKIEKLNFAGIGTREIKQNGLNAIKEVYEKTLII